MDLPNQITDIIERLKEDSDGNVKVFQHKTRKSLYKLEYVTPTKIKQLIVDTTKPDIGFCIEEDFDFIGED